MKLSHNRKLEASKTTSRMTAEESQHHYPHTSYNQLFTVEEAFIRLSQSGQNGELMVLNQAQSFHVYVEKGFVVYAEGHKKTGEAALSEVLDLSDSNFVWIADATPVIKDLYLDIREYLVRHSLSRDRKIAQSVEDQKRDTLALPKESPEAPPEIPASDFGFFFVPENSSGGEMPLTKTVSLVGREVYCDWVIDDPRLSRKHCMLQITGNCIRVRDLESTNGTTINGIRTAEGYLRPGDVLALGGYALVLHQEKSGTEVSTRTSQVALKMLSASMV